MSTVDPEIKALQRSIFWAKVRRARERAPGDKFADGPKLFDEACVLMKSGILAQNPEFTESQVDAELRSRLALRRRLDERGIYRDIDSIDG